MKNMKIIEKRNHQLKNGEENVMTAEENNRSEMKWK